LQNIKLSDFSLLQLSKIFTLFPLLGRVIFKYLDPTPLQLPPHQQGPVKIHPTVWSLHNLYIQIVYDMLGKQLYDEVYGYLQVLHPPGNQTEEETDEHSSEILRSCKDLMKTIAGLCFKEKQQESDINVRGDGSPKDFSRSKGNENTCLITVTIY
jgi:hypothetical protein